MTGRLFDVHFQSSEAMPQVSTGSVQAIICSPPYWNLKDYEHDGQIGYGDTYEEYLDRLDVVWRECKRVLKKNGTMWIVIDKVTRRRIMRNIPYDIALRCMRMGFVLQDMVIWNKPSAIGGMNPRNIVNKFETIIFLSKTPRRFKFRPNALPKGRAPDFNSRDELTNLWRIPVRAGNLWKSSEHKAPFPTELAERLVRLSTDSEDLVLDPYLGSGTTMRAAMALGRRCVGYEVNPAFKSFITQTLEPVLANGHANGHGNGPGNGRAGEPVKVELVEKPVLRFDGIVA